MIRLYVKIPEIAFSRIYAGLCIHHLFVWLNVNFLHNSPWVTLPTLSSLVLYSFWVNLLHSLIMWLLWLLTLLLLLLYFASFLHCLLLLFLPKIPMTVSVLRYQEFFKVFELVLNCAGLDNLLSSSDLQFIYSLLVTFEGSSTCSNYNWFHHLLHVTQLFHLSGNIKVFVHISFFVFFLFLISTQSRRVSKLNNPTTSRIIFK